MLNWRNNRYFSVLKQQGNLITGIMMCYYRGAEKKQLTILPVSSGAANSGLSA